MGMKNRIWTLICLLLVLAFGAAEAAEFSADLFIREGNLLKEGRILVRDEMYRMDIEDPSGPGVVVQMLPAQDLCRVLVPRYSLFLEIARSEGIARMVDPFLAAEAMKGYYTCVEEGSEDLAGRTCTREAFKSGDTTLLYRWISGELGFPLKISLVGQEDHFTELKNVKIGAVAEDLFDIPAGYQKSDWSEIRDRVENDPQMTAKQEAWAAKQPRQTELDAFLNEGDEFRALVGSDLSIKVTVENSGDLDLVWSLVEMKRGEALPAREMTGPGKIEFSADSGVNLVVLRCLKGTMRGKVALSGLGKLTLATKELEQRKSGGGRGRSLPAELTAFRLRVKSLESPGESTLAVRISLTLEGPRDGSGEDESIQHRLEPGQEKIFERIGLGVIGGYDLTLLGPGGRGEVELTIDYRPLEEQQPF